MANGNSDSLNCAFAINYSLLAIRYSLRFTTRQFVDSNFERMIVTSEPSITDFMTDGATSIFPPEGIANRAGQPARATRKGKTRPVPP